MSSSHGSKIAQLLNVAEQAVYSMAKKGLRPAFDVGAHWRFKRVDHHLRIDEQKAASRDEEPS